MVSLFPLTLDKQKTMRNKWLFVAMSNYLDLMVTTRFHFYSQPMDVNISSNIKNSLAYGFLTPVKARIMLVVCLIGIDLMGLNNYLNKILRRLSRGLSKIPYII